MIMLNHLAKDCSLLAATFQDLRFGIIFMFSSKIKTFVGGDGLNSRLGSSTHNSFQFLYFFYFIMNEKIVDVLYLT
jgi:hypothetical protein